MTLAAGLVVIAAIVALALYRVLSRASGLDLRVGSATVGIAFALACAVALVVPGTARAVLRRWRWMRATDDMSRAHAAWRSPGQPRGHGCGLPAERAAADAGEPGDRRAARARRGGGT